MNKMRERAAKRHAEAAGNATEEGEPVRRSSSEGTAVNDDGAERTAEREEGTEEEPRFEKIKTAKERRPNNLEHTLSGPYDIDRVNTRESFRRTKSGRSR
jgi:hypothetical protein